MLFISNMDKKLFTEALQRMRSSNMIKKTPLVRSDRLSAKYKCNIYLKREDTQTIRSFKIRGAYNKIIQSNSSDIVTASAGNHAQGVSQTCYSLGMNHHIFLPIHTPDQKINRIKYFGKDKLKLHLHGNTFDECFNIANEYSKNNNYTFVHPFDDEDVIIGQGTIGVEIEEDLKADIVIMPVGGGGLISGVGSYLKDSLIYGVEPNNADSLTKSLCYNKRIKIDNIDTFVDGASIQLVGKRTFKVCKNVVDDMFVVNNNKVSYHMIDMYQNEGIILEPAGALSISCLDMIPNLNGKNVVCVISGGNNDISRYPDIIEKSLLYKSLKHYFLIKFNQKHGELKKYMNNILGEKDNITRFEYLKKNNKDFGMVLIGIEVENKKDVNQLLFKMNQYELEYVKLYPNELLYNYLI